LRLDPSAKDTCVIVYIIRRFLLSIPVLFAATFVTFVAVSYAGDPLSALKTNPRINPRLVHDLTLQYHLDKPVPLRYFYWIDNFVTHKFGTYLIGSGDIWPDVTRTLGHTLQVVLVAEVIAFILGVLIGIFSAVRQYSVFDYFFTSFSFLGFAMPTFLLALLLQELFVEIYLKWNVRIFYVNGLNTPGVFSTWSLDRLQHIALPVITLCIVSLAVYSRYMRAAMLDVLNTDYVRTARAKGLAEWRVIMRHVFRNALIPMTTIAALNIGAVFGGAIITETIFTLDGFGYWFIGELNNQDTYAVMAYLVITGSMIILFNLIADIVYGFLDPRIRLD
jgi:peptide/nickel transport system permease protein